MASSRKESALKHLAQSSDFVRAGNLGPYNGQGLRDLGRMATEIMTTSHALISGCCDPAMLTLPVQDHIKTVNHLVEIICA